MNSETFCRLAREVKDGKLPEGDDLIEQARTGLYEMRVMLDALWACCARLKQENKIQAKVIASQNKIIDKLLDGKDRSEVTGDV